MSGFRSFWFSLLKSSSPGLTRGSRGALEMPTDQVRGLKAHGSSPAMTGREGDSTRAKLALMVVRESMVINHHDAGALDPLRQRRKAANGGDHLFDPAID